MRCFIDLVVSENIDSLWLVNFSSLAGSNLYNNEINEKLTKTENKLYFLSLS